jgi:hypothetical protein
VGCGEGTTAYVNPPCHPWTTLPWIGLCISYVFSIEMKPFLMEIKQENLTRYVFVLAVYS